MSLNVGAVRQCELYDFLFTVEAQANADPFSFVDLLHDAPALVVYPVLDSGVDEIGRVDLGKLLAKATDDISPIAGSLSKLGDGIRTVAFAVDGPKATAEALDAERVRKIGGAFIHPQTACLSN